MGCGGSKEESSKSSPQEQKAQSASPTQIQTTTAQQTSAQSSPSLQQQSPQSQPSSSSSQSTPSTQSNRGNSTANNVANSSPRTPEHQPQQQQQQQPRANPLVTNIPSLTTSTAQLTTSSSQNQLNVSASSSPHSVDFSPSRTPLPPLESNDPRYFPSYVGAMERRDAENLLLTANPGVFCVRWSDNRKFYAITYVSPARRILHMGEINFDTNTPRVRILRENGPQFFPTFQELLKTLISEKLFDTPFEVSNYGSVPAETVPAPSSQQQQERVYDEIDW